MKIETKNLGVKINGRDIIRDLSFECESGSSVAVTGPSGCGKTTLLNVIGKMLPPDSGQLFLDGKNATTWNEKQCRQFWRESASFILQDAGLDDEETVAYNITLRKGLWGKTKPTSEILEILQRVGLEHRANDPVIQLSGGEKRRVAIARAIYRKATVIFADEPTASLDDNSRAIVQKLLLKENHETTVVISTHDLELATACNTTIELKRLQENLPN